MILYPLHFIWTAFILILEALSKTFWVLFVWVLICLGLFFSGFNAALGDTVQAILTLVFYTGCGVLLLKNYHNFRWPTHQHIIRRIEKSSALKHAPITAQKDTLSQGSGKLWQSYKLFLAQQTSRLTFALPQNKIAQQDPKRLRFIALFVFICGALLAGPNIQHRFIDGVTLKAHNLIPDIPKPETALAIWIKPPDYTGISQTKMTKSDAPLIVPEGSELKATVTKSLKTPSLDIQDTAHDVAIFETTFASIEDSGFVFEGYSFGNARPETDYLLAIKHGLFKTFKAPFQILEDTAPKITLASAPIQLPLGLLRIPTTVSDDYGVTSITLKVELANIGRETTPLGVTYTETRGLSTAPQEERTIEHVYDLTSHPWSGLAVEITVIAEDAAGHKTSSAPLPLILPKRNFEHPLAKQLITYRNGLIWKPQEDHYYIAGKLNQILNTPQLFDGDIVTTLALRSASSRLYYTPQREEARLKAAKSLIPLLWHIALKIEDGNLTLASQNLQDAQNKLQNALNNPDASDAQMQELIQNVQQALMEYLAEMSKELQKRMQNGETSIIDPAMIDSIMGSGVMEDLMAEIQDKIAQGDKKGAQELLSELQNFMASMNPSMTIEMPQDMQDMQQAINDLKDLINAQKDLRDKTQTQADTIKDFIEDQEVAKQYQLQIQQAINQLNLSDPAAIESLLKQLPQPKMGTPPDIDTNANAGEQRSLEEQLKAIMDTLNEKTGETPDSLPKAGQEMTMSTEALTINAPLQSVQHQNQALEHLEQGNQSMSEQLQQRMQEMIGKGMMQMPFMMGSQGMQYDPLGRPMNPSGEGQEGQNSKDIKLLNDDQRKQAREIQRVLRERSGDASRPREERDYLRRLLKRF
jgi:uncharacterized protein (TIGR02302 family)